MLYHVVEEDGVRRLLFSRKQQSSMRLDDPFESDLPMMKHLHLPLAIKLFGAEKGWRFWSESEPNVHYAAYRFADMNALKQALASVHLKDLIADFDKNWPKGITRTREILNLAEELGG